MENFGKKLCCAVLFVLILLPLLPGSGLAATGNDKIVIMLDPGHGGGSIGTAAGDIGEKVMTLRLATLIRERLQENGNFAVYMTRETDTDVSLPQRAVLADRVNADLLISIHFDGSPNPGDRGVTAYTSVFDQWALVELGADICNGLSAATGLSSNGVRQKHDTNGYYWNEAFQWDAKDKSLGTLSDYYGIPTWCAKFGIPSMIMEHGFFSNDGDRARIFADGTLERMADAEAQAIIRYYTGHTHTYGEAEQDFPSNCMFTGKISSRCVRCGHRQNVQSLAPAPDRHYWEITDQAAASCGVDGYTQYTCRITSNLNEKGYPAENHTWRETIPAPTEHEYVQTEHDPAGHGHDGYAVYRCTNCASSFRETEKGEPHTYEFVEHTEPSCTQAGGNVYQCTACGDTYTDGTPAPGHTFDPDGEIYIAPGCDTPGCRRQVCTVCGYMEEETIEATGHIFAEEEVQAAPACTTDGLQIKKCTVCAGIKKKILPATGHVWDEEKIEKAPGIFYSGKRVAVCKNGCGAARETLLHPRILTEGVWYVVAAAALAWAAALGLLIYMRCRGRKNFSGKKRSISALPEDSAEKGNK